MKSLKDYTIEDALADCENGFDVICQDGHVGVVTNMDYEEIIRKEV